MKTEAQVIGEIREEANKTTQRAVAERLGVQPQVICDVLMGRRNISQTLARAMGYIRTYSFTRVD